ncbi:hypothetical protein D3C85_1233880 [compost metagenome]
MKAREASDIHHVLTIRLGQVDRFPKVSVQLQQVGVRALQKHVRLEVATTDIQRPYRQ